MIILYLVLAGVPSFHYPQAISISGSTLAYAEAGVPTTCVLASPVAIYDDGHIYAVVSSCGDTIFADSFE